MKKVLHTSGVSENEAVGRSDDASLESTSSPPTPISYAQALVFLDDMAEFYTQLLLAEEACEKPRSDRIRWLRAAIADMEQRLSTLKRRDEKQIQEVAAMYRQLRRL
ncbi:MAG: hypothetical protein ACTHL8_11190 [Burkholderiaceae bacterium]